MVFYSTLVENDDMSVLVGLNLGEMPRTFDLPMLINKVMAFTQLTSAKNCDFI
jgi:hypothetical protein